MCVGGGGGGGGEGIFKIRIKPLTLLVIESEELFITQVIFFSSWFSCFC